MDDLAFINNDEIIKCLDHNSPLNENEIYSLYPLDFLQIKPTYDTCNTSYLNVEINLLDDSEGEFYSCTTWKKDRLPCKTVDFIQAWSNRPKGMSYKVCLSQVVPILYNASHMIFALEDLQKLCSSFVKNGFKIEHISKVICYFLEHNDFPGIKYSLTILIKEFKDKFSL